MTPVGPWNYNLPSALRRLEQLVVYDVAQLLTEKPGAFFTYGVGELFAVDSDIIERVEGFVYLTRVDKGVWAKAELELKLDRTCSRCLRGFREPLTMSIDEECLFQAEVEPQLESKSLDEVVIIDQDNILDLREVARQAMVMNRSMKPLCQPDCLGICSICGGDRAVRVCQCGGDAIDPRWAALVKLAAKSKA